MKVLVACEFSGIVRDAFRAAGHYAVSCDLEPTEREGAHIQDDIRNVDVSNYDLLISHPPCTYLSNAGSRWFYEGDRYLKREEALDLVEWLLYADVKRKCLENPLGVIGRVFWKHSQIVQPYEYGHREKKRTCLWLDNLPNLVPTNFVENHMQNAKTDYWFSSEGRRDKRIRSRTFYGIAEAMAEQWGEL